MKKMNERAQMYVYEAVIIVIMIVAAVAFIAASSPQPTISNSTRLFQLETKGADALRLADKQEILKSAVISAYNNDEQISSSDPLITYLDEAIVDYLLSARYSIKVNGNTCYQTNEPGESTVSTHRILTTTNGALYDVQLLMWYRGS